MTHMIEDFFKDATVVVTGGAGFVGSHLVDRLLDLDAAKVIVVDNLSTGNSSNLKQAREATSDQEDRLEFHHLDISQTGPEHYLSPDLEIDAVFHLASPASPPLYQAHPINTYLVNSYGTHLLLSYLLQRHNKARFLYASTSEVYGDPEVHPQPEEYWGNVNPNGPRSCYDEGKRMGETVCGVFAREHNMNVRIVRIFNTYGPRIDPHDGRVIPTFIRQALDGQELTIHGDGLQTRSYCYVDDLVQGLLKMMAHKSMGGRTVNLGNPDEFTVRETAQVIYKSITGESLDFDEDTTTEKRPEDDPSRRQPDITEAKRTLQWKPTVNFADGIAKTVAWFRENK